MGWENLSDRELLVVVADDVRDMKHTIHGNGRPGLVERMATLEERVPGKKSRATLVGSAVAAFVFAAASAVKAMV
jgi:hypothetical protein